MKKVTVQTYLKNKSLAKDKSYEKLAKPYITKARNNLITMNILSQIEVNQEAKKLLHVPENYTSDEWIITTAYYAMYSAATALLAKIGYKSGSHNATIAALEHFFVKKELIEKEYIEMFKRVLLSKEEIENISKAKEEREIAQYRVNESITKKTAEDAKKNAYDFVAKAELLIKD